MITLAIDTSCDDTSAAVVSDFEVLSNVVSSQEQLHREFGGVMPTLAKLEHQQRIGKVIELALRRSKVSIENISQIAVTAGPGLSMALEVGIGHAKQLAEKYNKPLVMVNHMEGHMWAAAGFPRHSKTRLVENLQKPLGVLISGKHTEIVQADADLNYNILAETKDDAIGEAFDKAARLIGMGYPGGSALAQLADHNVKANPIKIVKGSQGVRVVLQNSPDLNLPIPLSNSQTLSYSYSGLKTAFWQLVTKVAEVDKVQAISIEGGWYEIIPLSRNRVEQLAVLFQGAAVEHLIYKFRQVIEISSDFDGILVGGGVANNKLIRKRLRAEGKKINKPVYFPYHRRLTIDNAAMIAIAANLRCRRGKEIEVRSDRNPNWSLKEL